MNFFKAHQVKDFYLFLLIILLVPVAFTLSISIGSVHIPFTEVWKIILRQPIENEVFRNVVWSIRFPRTLAAIFGGSALACAGLILQVFFRNPIADPWVLGIPSGAALAVGVLLVFSMGPAWGVSTVSPYAVSLAAFAGAVGVVFILMAVANRLKNVVTLLIFGMMLGYLFTAGCQIAVALLEKGEAKGFTLWTFGSFAGITWEKVFILVPVSATLLIATFLISKPLNAFLLGENYAQTMGVNIKTFHFIIIMLCSGLIAIVTAFAGPVSFIGLAVPHLGRLLLRTSENRVLVPGVILLGASVTCLCDLLARTLFSPVVLPISAVTAAFGVPVVVFFLLRRGVAL